MATEVEPISTLTITVDDEEKLARLRERAALHGRTLDEEAGEVLQAALVPTRADNMVQRLRRHFEALGGADDLKIPPRYLDSDFPFTFGFDDIEDDE